jgi:uncharacterized membrane protein YqhA
MPPRGCDGQLTAIERAAHGYRALVERMIFASRWLLAPFYVGLAVSLLVLLIKFGQKTVKLLSDAFPSRSSAVITNVLSLIWCQFSDCADQPDPDGNHQ